MIAARPAVLDRSRGLVEPALRDAVARLAPELQLAASYHFGWVERDGTPTRGDGGKGVRGGLALLSAQAVGADVSVALPGAVAVELVHNFSLMHDDVIDHDTERRHRATVWAAFGVGDAIVAGDALLTLALQVLLEQPTAGAVRAATALATATQRMIGGQAADMAFEGRASVTLDECLAMERGKTAALLGCAASIGAILADAPDSCIHALASYGEHLGLAFQAIDDLLGIWGDAAITGKSVGSDLREHKKSLPVSVALTRANGIAPRLERLLCSDLDEVNVARATALIDACGGRAGTEAIAREHLDRALAALDSVPLVPTAAGELADLARFVAERRS